MTPIIRPHGYGHAAAALRNLERRQAVIANNLANVSTTGFKGEQVFARLLEDGGAPVLDSATDFRTGAITETKQPLDLAIERDGFFVTESEHGEQLIRGGSLHLNDARVLVDASGNPVLGEDDEAGGVHGPVIIPADTVSLRINPGGVVFADGKQIARLRFERAPNGVRLEHAGGGAFVAPPGRERVPVNQRSVRQGALEDSNVNSVETLVDLIGVQRAYAGAQKCLTTIDSARGIMVGDIARST